MTQVKDAGIHCFNYLFQEDLYVAGLTITTGFRYQHQQFLLHGSSNEGCNLAFLVPLAAII